MTKELLAKQMAELELREAQEKIVSEAQELADSHITLMEKWRKMIAELEGPWLWEQVEDVLGISL